MYNYIIKTMQFIKENLYKLFLLTYGFIVPSVSFAQYTPAAPVPCVAGTICNPISQSSLSGLIQTLLTGVIKIGIPVVALAVVYCGFLFVSARGNSEKLGKAKDALLYTLIGAAILFGSWALALLIQTTVTGL